MGWEEGEEDMKREKTQSFIGSLSDIRPAKFLNREENSVTLVGRVTITARGKYMRL